MTKKQRGANRRNAQSSTGPRSAQGKAAIAGNALKHGFYSNHAVLNGYEDAAEFAAVQAGFFGHLQPEGPIEFELAARIVLAVWQLRRIHSAETQALELELVIARDPELGIDTKFTGAEDKLLGFACQTDIRSDRPQFDGFARHFARWERTYYRALHELERVQLARRNRAIPPPGRADLQIGTAGLGDCLASPVPHAAETHPAAANPLPPPASTAGTEPRTSESGPSATATNQKPNPQNGFVSQNLAAASDSAGRKGADQPRNRPPHAR